MKENSLLPRDVLEHWKTRFLNIWRLFQKNVYFDVLDDIEKTELEKKIPNVTDFVKEAKLTELENKTLDISNLATKTALTSVENKIPSLSNLI